MSNLDNPYSGMINLMREQGAKYNSPELLVGEVLKIEPILIKVGDLELDKNDLYIADYLMPNYKRKYKITNANMSFSASSLNAPTNIVSHGHTASVGGESGSTNSVSHGHALTSIELNSNNLATNGEITFTDTGLKVGDKVAVQQINGANKLIVYCKLI